MTVVVRAGRDDDLPALTAVYNHYVEHTAATFDLEPWTVEERRAWLGRYAAEGPHRLLVAEDSSGVLGYATSSPFREKAAYARTVETTVYLAPGTGGRGTGSALYARLLDELADAGVHRAVACIALPNPASVALHRRHGFTDVGVMREVGRKHGQWWDLLWVERAVS